MKTIVSIFKHSQSDKYHIAYSMMYSVHLDGDLSVQISGEDKLRIDFDALKNLSKAEATVIANAINIAYCCGMNQQKKIIAKKLDLL